MKTILASVALAAGFACSTSSPEKSTGTNWWTCDSDDDCAAVSGARCSAENWCVDASGNRIVNPSTTSDAGGAEGAIDGGSHLVGSGGSDAGISSGGTASGGADAESGGTGGGSGGTQFGTVIVDCYSPGQNLDRAYDVGAVGCECPADAPGLCVQGVALICSDGRWQAVIDGPCEPQCWNPDQPDLAATQPGNGCACTTEDETQCLYTMASGYMLATCIGGRWSLDTEVTSCVCSTDAQCGFGSRCEQGGCLPGACEVNGVRYAVGVTNIPHPFNCNTCTCELGGVLSCTGLPCPSEWCPEGTVGATACIECGLADGCAIARTGCLARCSSDDDCTETVSPLCMPTENICASLCS